MAEYGSFAGQTMLVPGSYSNTIIDLGGSFPLSARGIVGIFGESSTGKPGSLEDIGSNFYTAEQLSDIVKKYGTGNISDACAFLFSPGNDGALPNGAQYVYIYKTNASTNASLAVDQKATGISNHIYFTSNLLGAGGDAITVTWATGVHPSAVVVSMTSATAITITADNAVATPADVITAIRAHAIANALVTVSAEYQPFNAYYTAWTINSAAAMLTLANGADAVTTLYSDVYGVAGNFLTFTNTITPETEATFLSTTAFDITAKPFIVGNQFTLQANGSPLNTFTFPAGADSYATQAALLGALNNATNWTTDPAGIVWFDMSGTDATSILKIRQVTKQNHHRDGYSRSMEIRNLTGTPLTSMNITPSVAVPTEPVATCLIKDTSANTSVTSVIGGNVSLAIGYLDSAATAATVTVGATTITLTSAGGMTPGTITFTKSQYPTLRELISSINIHQNWSAAVVLSSDINLPLSALDYVTTIGAISASGWLPARIKRDAYDFAQFLDINNSYIYASTTTFPTTGLFDAKVQKFFTNGVIGATAPLDITNALAAFEGVRCNSVVPLFSRNATADYADGLTDVNSTYQIASINAATLTHVIHMSTTQNRSERQACLSYKDTFSACENVSYGINSFRAQLCIQDIKGLSESTGNLMWYQPWAQSCLIAGARMGASVGTPMTHKYFNCSGIRQTADPMTTDDADITISFDPRTMKDAAILSGITFFEAPQSGGYRCVVDNTTYSTDGNWYYNRANVVYAGDIYSYDFRTKLEDIYVGVKNTLSSSGVKSTCASILSTYLNEGITVSTSDAPQGYMDLVVRIVGNTIYVNVTVKLVEGIDFIFIQTIVQRATSQA